MKSIHILRKPCSAPTVSANVLKHGTGGLNTDMTRIAGAPRSTGTITKGALPTGGGQTLVGSSRDRQIAYNTNKPTGRWPANLILQHLDGCMQDGVKKVKASAQATGPTRSGSSQSVSRSPYGGAATPAPFYGGEDGHETVADWACVQGCPVAALDAQSGISGSASGVVKYVRAETSGWKERGGSFTPGHTWEAQAYGDKGGASCYFKRVRS